MPSIRIKQIGEDIWATTMIILHPDRDVSTPMYPGDIVEVTNEDWAFLKDRLPFDLELVDDPPNRMMFDRSPQGPEPFTYLSLPPKEVEKPRFTPAQQAEIDRQIAEREAAVRAENKGWVDPASLPPPDTSGVSDLTEEEQQSAFRRLKDKIKGQSDEA